MDDYKPLPDFIKLKNESGTSEDVYYSITYKGLPLEFKARAEKELNETEERKTKGIKRLRELLKRENMPDVEDCILIAVLRSCKYNFKKSETRIKKFLKTRRMMAEKLADLDLKEIEHIIDDICIGFLPFRDKSGRAIFYTRPNINTNCYSVDGFFVVCVSSTLFLLNYPMTSVAGLGYIGECKGSSLSLYLSVLRSFRPYMCMFLDFPFRLGCIDIINEYAATRWLFNIIKPILSSKMVNRVNFCGSNLENLQNHYHPDILPEECGGNMGPMDTSYYKNIVLDFLRKLQAEGKTLKCITK